MTAAVLREPVGVVASIAPWNGPFNLAVSKLVPALVAGCSVVFKPAQETPFDVYELAEAFHEAGLPPGVFNLDHWWSRDGPPARRPSRCRQGQLHRLHQRRSGDRRRVRPFVQAGAARARWQVGGHHRRGRGSRHGHARAGDGLLLQHRPGVRRLQPRPRAAVALGRGGLRAVRHGWLVRRRGSVRSGHHDGAARRRASA